MFRPSQRVLSRPLFVLLTPNPQSLLSSLRAFMGPPESQSDRGRQWPGIRPRKTNIKTGKLVYSAHRRGVFVKHLPEGLVL